jgi:hypothetical protein
VGNFISSRTMTLILLGCNTDAFPMQMGIPQGSPLSPFIFLFHSANLVSACKPLTLPALSNSFVDNVNTLVFSKSTEENCRTLHIVHE